MNQTQLVDEQRKLLEHFRQVTARRASVEASSRSELEQAQQHTDGQQRDARAQHERVARDAQKRLEQQKQVADTEYQQTYKVVEDYRVRLKAERDNARSLLREHQQDELLTKAFKNTSSVSTPPTSTMSRTSIESLFGKLGGSSSRIQDNLNQWQTWQSQHNRSQQIRRVVMSVSGVVVAIVLLIGVIVGYRVWSYEQHYQAALQALESGQWQEARDQLEALPASDGWLQQQYLARRDTRTPLLESYYQAVIEASSLGDWPSAASNLVRLRQLEPSYKDVDRLAVDNPPLSEAVSKLYPELWLIGDPVFVAMSWPTDLGSISTLRYSLDGQRLLTSSTLQDRQHIRLWNTGSGSLVSKITVNERLLGPSIVYPSEGAAITGWLSRDELVIANLDLEAEQVSLHRIAIPQLYVGVGGLIHSFAENGSRLATNKPNFPIEVWQLPDERLLQILEGTNSRILDLSLSADAEGLAAVAIDGTVSAWHVADGTLLFTSRALEADTGELPYTVAFSPDNSVLVATDGAGSISLISAADGSLLWTEAGKDGREVELAFTSDARVLAVSSGDNHIRLLRSSDGEEIQDYHFDENINVQDLTFSPNSEVLAVGLSNGEVQLLKVRTPQ